MLFFLTFLLIVVLLYVAGAWGLNRIDGWLIALCWLSCAIAFWLFPVFAAVITGRGVAVGLGALGALIHLPVLFSIISWVILFSIAWTSRYRKHE